MSLTEQWYAIYQDMRGKMSRADWHGVRDACVDLELIECKMRYAGIEVPKPS